ncbi:MAG TPA: flagellar motor protein MotB [Lachnospiraceae bacterium]|nr:flagellar motor protein MotB [Lachnospiraceae bacterium]
MSNDKFRNQDDGDDEEEANWQDSYSDLVTDLLAIFVILFAFAMLSQAIQISKDREAEIQDLISISTESDNVLPGESGLLPEEDSLDGLYQSIKGYIEETGLSQQLSVNKLENNQILLRVASSAFFDSGQATIDDDAEILLSKISELMTQYKDSIKMVRIEGHTDNIPIKTFEYDSNWELSTSRAVNVLRRLLELSELVPEQLSAVGYSEFYPISDNRTDTGRALNRRVDFFIEAVDE